MSLEEDQLVSVPTTPNKVDVTSTGPFPAPSQTASASTPPTPSMIIATSVESSPPKIKVVAASIQTTPSRHVPTPIETMSLNSNDNRSNQHTPGPTLSINDRRATAVGDLEDRINESLNSWKTVLKILNILSTSNAAALAPASSNVIAKC